MKGFPIGSLCVGARVRYAPGHAKGNFDHPDCEDGIVRSFNSDGYPFVVYDNAVRGVMHNLEVAERWTAACTNPADLRLLSDPDKAPVEEKERVV